ncbi:hypothetical protein JCGZ_08786 [Jatropha curcas]|uniref:Transcription repressor n=2 Tax=Jatropha curcas TaxID=180498 RepID=A0A067KJ33_JATCU|nr:hypothetical protein JCGZ_08786 [Jatropha curcas]
MKLPFLSKINTNSSSSSKSSWSWSVYCQQPKTLSFRTNNNNMFKTLNSSYNLEETHESWFTNSSSESASFSTAASDDDSAAAAAGESLETVIRGLRSERLFFEPEETSSILDQVKNNNGEFPFKESIVLSMDSQEPYLDFKKSMEEMVEAHGLKDWEGLEELLCCYLKVNGKSNHGYIIGAFVDLLVDLAFASHSSTSTISDSSSCCCCSCSPSSPLSFYTSSNFSDDYSSCAPCVSSLQVDQEEVHLTTPCLSKLEGGINESKEN